MKKKKEKYRTFLWMGQVRYRCPYCEYDSYLKESVDEHIRDVHRDQTPQAMLNFGLLEETEEEK